MLTKPQIEDLRRLARAAGGRLATSPTGDGGTLSGSRARAFARRGLARVMLSASGGNLAEITPKGRQELRKYEGT